MSRKTRKALQKISRNAEKTKIAVAKGLKKLRKTGKGKTKLRKIGNGPHKTGPHIMSYATELGTPISTPVATHKHSKHNIIDCCLKTDSSEIILITALNHVQLAFQVWVGPSM